MYGLPAHPRCWMSLRCKAWRFAEHGFAQLMELAIQLPLQLLGAQFDEPAHHESLAGHRAALWLRQKAHPNSPQNHQPHLAVLLPLPLFGTQCKLVQQPPAPTPAASLRSCPCCFLV